jgi:hypothetical protein
MKSEKTGALDNYYTRAELAGELGKTVKTLERWARELIGPPVTVVVTDDYYYKPSVEKWLRSLERPSKPATGNTHTTAA